MTQRLSIHDIDPAAYEAVLAMERYVRGSGLDKPLYELIKIRASQLNGCAYCLNKHIGDAIKLGEDPCRMYVLSAWREAKDWFTEEEQIIIRLTEEITQIGQHGISDEVYDRALTLFGEQKLAHLILAAVSINGWNRIGVGLNLHPSR